MNSTILVTGGSGFIGSHTTVALQQAGYRVLILDNLCNSRLEVLSRIKKITGTEPGFVKADIRDSKALAAVFQSNRIAAVMHFAGLKAVGESNQQPLQYYDNNVNGSVQLLTVMKQAGVKVFVFSSSATVYGDPQRLPLTEDHPRSATNPYGHTKLVVEDILESLYKAEGDWRIARLRYFNPVGAHPSGLIGEAPQGTPNNLMPYVAQVAVGARPRLQIFGGDYNTADGTGVRDYIHVTDLAQGHVAALRYCEQMQDELLTVNLGTGKGYSVLEMVHAFEQASSKPIAYDIVGRRAGDIAACWADTTQAERKLGWRASKSIKEMCDDAWRWQVAPGSWA
ncbi:UDP-glucose 4-epimerase GalE [Eoetvoesiella caeni]|uniref:UDP-glucose 4-epimerase n=1 Tax=Eoetvoesiella caeni TaxID=645616 RepID=A0A366H445_9BURK|nr:UDP-glucose 4-epimerase GalE [Eoetvoesiella caeni]MCI2810880.1 UDP-glucose 4-epimerase GalE [Eoetvoesiella caeni]NYT56821.1 UDP-glucose 4-epimerase GalE [Eoetvoesiella caeni]RBP35619.1 UDP-galactose 4-epimerase [Eoetvoesiella caeni]